jgi:hypothetical protein
MERLALRDRRILIAQLGRRPRGTSSVETRCRFGYPQVVQVHPLMRGKPFPTLFWLSCPYLTREIDRLEAMGWVGRLEGLLREDAALAGQFAAAHDAYVAERLALLSAREQAALEAAGRLTSLTQRGIGGIQDRSRVKCLHLHVAHALARENPVGERILLLLPQQGCAEDDTICRAFESE